MSEWRSSIISRRLTTETDSSICKLKLQRLPKEKVRDRKTRKIHKDGLKKKERKGIFKELEVHFSAGKKNMVEDEEGQMCSC